MVADWIGKLACVAAGIGIALVPQLVTRALPAGVTVLELRDEQAPYRRVVAITDARRQPSELTRMFIRLAKQAASRSQLNADNVHYVKLVIERPFPGRARVCCPSSVKLTQSQPI